MLNIVKTKQIKTANKNLKLCKLKVLFKATNKLKNYFRYKGPVPEILRSNSVYIFSCRSCTASYIGDAYMHIKKRVSKHHKVSPRTRKPVRGPLSTSVTDHILISDHIAAWEDFKILGRNSNKFILELYEACLLKGLNQPLKRTDSSMNCVYSSLSF